MDVESADPIFILGIMPRSGTNFLWDLLLLHPDIAPARDPIREDFFLQQSGRLSDFASSLWEWWDPMWGSFPTDLEDQLCAAIGDGLISFLWSRRDKRLLTKTPSVENLDHFFRFFPKGRLVIIVRDGRSVVESSMATFRWDLDTAARRWRRGADTIQSFRRRSSSSSYHLLRYEDLLGDLHGELQRIFDFLGLRGSSYDFERAEQLPVRGSSAFLGEGRDAIHWDPVPKDDSFDAGARWRRWDAGMLERFEWIAGPQLGYFGYPTSLRPIEGSGRRLRHTLRDQRWTILTAARRTLFLLRVRVGTATRPLRRRLGLLRGHS